MHWPKRGGFVAWLLGVPLLLGAVVPLQAQTEPRFGHSSTLLPDGNILVVGGAQDTNQFLSTTTLMVEARNADIAKTNVPVTNGGTGRAYHTATLLSNGEVLVVGGRNGSGVEGSWAVYSPSQNCWRPAQADANAARFNHTATLLKAPAASAGVVLICGGQNAVAAPSSLATCSLFTPTVPAPADACAAAGGAIAAGPALLVNRSSHTASLLADGRVFLTGGYDDTGGSSLFFINTSEIYNPFIGAVSAAKALITARTGHQATVLANGKVLISGGFNGRDVVANKGILDSSELYDPIADSMVPAGKLLARVSQHGAALDTDGRVVLSKGLGNITTTYIDASGNLESGSFLTGTFPGTSFPQMNVTGGTLDRVVAFDLSVPVTGVIQDGIVLMSTPQVNFGLGNARFPYGVDAAPPTGLTFNLGNVTPFCSAATGECGRVEDNFVLSPTAGSYLVDAIDMSPEDLLSMTGGNGGSRVNWAGGLTNAGTLALASSSRFRGTMTINGLSKIFIGGTISTGTLRIISGQVSNIPVTDQGGLTSSDGDITVVLTNGHSIIPGGTAVTTDPDGNGQLIFAVDIGTVSGTVSTTTDTVQTGPRNINGLTLGGMTGTIMIGPTRLNFDAGESFTVDVATVIVKAMMFGDNEHWDPTPTVSGAEWEFGSRGGVPRYGHTLTVTPTNDFRQVGGRACDLTSNFCARQIPLGVSSIIHLLPAWGDGGDLPGDMPRGNHTATLLPNGKILAAGGSNGPNVLDTAFLFDPLTDEFTPTGKLFDARDLHTATLLPNGRVLVAGGFTTNLTSTGPTSSAELYLPEIGTWVRTQDMPFAADNHTAVLLADGNVLVAGGYTGGVYLNNAAIYYSTSGAWAPIPPMPAARALHTATLLQDGRVLIAGGINASGPLCSAVLYDPNQASHWLSVANIGAPASACLRAHSHAATLLRDGRVLVSGGNDGFGEIALSVIYDPHSNSWENTDNPPSSNQLNIPRFNHTATALPNGVVLVAGGAQALGNALRSVETFSVGASSWQVAGALVAPRSLHTMTVLADGRLAAIGGHDGTSFRADADSIHFAGSKDGETPGAPPSPRLSTITAVDMSPFNRSSFVTVTGQRLLGLGEAGGGGGGGNASSHHGPRLLLQAAGGSGGTSSQGDSAFVLDVTTRIYQGTDGTFFQRADSSITVQMPAFGWPNAGAVPAGGQLLPYGWYHLRAYQNAAYSDSLLVQAGPPKPAAPPTAVTGTPLSTNTISWTWTPPAGAFDGFNVYSSSTGVLITTRPAALPDYIQTNFTPNATAQITVAAYTLSGDGPLATSTTFYTLSTAPVNVAISSVSFDRLTLTWDFNGNAQGTVYEISQSTDNFQTGPSISTPVPTLLGVTTDNALITGLQTNTTYYFRMRAFNGLGVPSTFSLIVSTRTRAPVTGLSGAALSPTSIQWNWVDPGGVSFFNVYNTTTGAVIASTTTTTFVDVNLGTNTERSIMVSAVTSAGEGPLSNSATVFTLAAVPGFLNPPYILLTTGSFTAAWSANGNPLGTRYELVRTSEATTIALDTVTTQGFTGAFGDLVPAALQFGSRVRALNEDNIPSAFLVLGASHTLARAPLNLAITGTTPNSISLSWDSNGNSQLASYEVTFTTDGFASVQTGLPFSALSAQTTLTVGGLTTGTTYEFRVRAQNANGAPTAFSASVTTSPFNGGGPPGTIAGFIFDEAATISGTLPGTPPRQVTLFAPEGTFPSVVFVTISSITVPPSPCGALGTSVGVEITVTPKLQPLQPMILTVGYTAAEVAGIDLTKAAMNRVDETTGRCVPLNTSVETDEQTVRARLNHLSTFQLAQVNPSATAETTHIFPNPYYPSRNQQYVTFSNMPSGARVRVYTMRGEQLFDGNANAAGLAYWNGLNRTGRHVASGVYLAVIESNGDKAIKKVVVLR